MSEDTVVLGKRKQRDANDERPAGSTLFVSNLPYSATSIDLQTLFSDLAPVRSAFVVLENNVSKGVGYVSFAIKEDAKTALETIERDGIAINGRKLRVQLADRKPSEPTEKKVKGERTSQPGASQPRARASFPKVAKDPDAIRTIIIAGLPPSVDQKTLWKKVRKCDGAKSVELIEGEAGIANVLFSNPASASHAVDKLHAHTFKGAILSVTLKKRLETLAKNPTANKEGSNISITPNRASRLIIRNVPWNITEKDLRALFLPYGPIHSVTIPPSKQTSDEGEGENAKPKLRARGFAFVWFFSKQDAARAIEGVNGREVVAGAIGVPTMNRKERARLRRRLRDEAKKNEADDGTAEKKDDGDESMDGSDDEGEEADEGEKEIKEVKNPEARILAVDWALSKEKWEEAKAKISAEQEEESAKSEEDSELASEDEESESDEENGDDVDSEDEENRSEAEEPIKPTLPQTDVGTTLFVRNIAFDATEEELRVLFRAFGPMRYARITKDPETERSRGTGFVCFWNVEDADKAIRQSELLAREAGLGPAAPKKNPFSLPSLLTPDPSSSLAQSLVLHGRTLDVTRAVTRTTAVELKDANERAREKSDKRNLYLLREGVIFPGSPAEATLSRAELEKRNDSFNARKALLRSNPALYVSKTRLSLRGLPTWVTERGVKRLGMHAMRAFEDEVKRGERQGLSVDELRVDEDDTIEHAGGGEKVEEKKVKGKGRKFERETGVKQAKVVRQNDRVDTLTGKGKSRGYGFLEMNKHSDALRVLRWTNNNQGITTLLEGWWRDELENLIKMLGKGKKDEEGEGEDVEARLKRMKSELERLKSGAEGGRERKEGKALIVEFSIENAQVVNRRRDKIESTKLASKRVQRDSKEDTDSALVISTTAKPHKKRKLENPSASKAGNDAPKPERESKPTNDLGSMIGRKRKMRKSKGKA